MENGNPQEQISEEKKIKIPPIYLLREELAREEAKYTFRKTLYQIAAALVVAAAITALLATRLFILIRINGNSMAPTLKDGEIIVIRQTKEVEQEIEIGKEGDVYVNGKKLDEPYLGEKNLGKCELEFPYRVPEGMMFVLGDNRAISIDSRIRSIGCVDEEQIVGKVVFRAWPMARMGSVLGR